MAQDQIQEDKLSNEDFGFGVGVDDLRVPLAPFKISLLFEVTDLELGNESVENFKGYMETWIDDKFESKFAERGLSFAGAQLGILGTKAVTRASNDESLTVTKGGGSSRRARGNRSAQQRSDDIIGTTIILRGGVFFLESPIPERWEIASDFLSLTNQFESLKEVLIHSKDQRLSQVDHIQFEGSKSVGGEGEPYQPYVPDDTKIVSIDEHSIESGDINKKSTNALGYIIAIIVLIFVSIISVLSFLRRRAQKQKYCDLENKSCMPQCSPVISAKSTSESTRCSPIASEVGTPTATGSGRNGSRVETGGFVDLGRCVVRATKIVSHSFDDIEAKEELGVSSSSRPQGELEQDKGAFPTATSTHHSAMKSMALSSCPSETGSHPVQYQQHAIHPLDWSAGGADSVGDSTSSENPSQKKQRGPKPGSRENIAKRPLLCGASVGSGESDQFMKDLLWLKTKISGEALPNSGEAVEGCPESRSLRNLISPIGSARIFRQDQPPAQNDVPRGTRCVAYRDYYAPPGKLHMVVRTSKDGPSVHSIRKGSSLEGKLFPNDVIVAIDNVDTRTFKAEEVIHALAAAADNERKITVLRFEEET